jgi:hypothetical protein
MTEQPLETIKICFNMSLNEIRDTFSKDRYKSRKRAGTNKTNTDAT